MSAREESKVGKIRRGGYPMTTSLGWATRPNRCIMKRTRLEVKNSV